MQVPQHQLKETENPPRELERRPIYAEYQCSVRVLYTKSALYGNLSGSEASALFYKSECCEYKEASLDWRQTCLISERSRLTGALCVIGSRTKKKGKLKPTRREAMHTHLCVHRICMLCVWVCVCVWGCQCIGSLFLNYVYIHIPHTVANMQSFLQLFAVCWISLLFHCLPHRRLTLLHFLSCSWMPISFITGKCQNIQPPPKSKGAPTTSSPIKKAL